MSFIARVDLILFSTRHYGAQAVVVSIDPKRVYVDSPETVNQSPEGDALSKKTVVELEKGVGPNGEKYCWWQVTVKGGRETRDLDAVQLAKVFLSSSLLPVLVLSSN